MNKDQRKIFEKKLLYKSCYRGSKETDLIIGEFAKQNIEQMSNQDLKDFNELLDLSDGDIYDWYMGKKPIPNQLKSNILLKLMKFDLHK